MENALTQGNATNYVSKQKETKVSFYPLTPRRILVEVSFQVGGQTRQLGSEDNRNAMTRFTGSMCAGYNGLEGPTSCELRVP